MNLNIIKKRAFKNKIIKLMICILLVFSIFTTNFINSYANPGIALGSAEGLTQIISQAAGLEVASSSYMGMTSSLVYESLTPEQLGALNVAVSNWNNDGYITLTEELFNSIQSVVATLHSNNQSMINLSAGNIVTYQTNTGLTAIYNKNTSSILGTSTTMRDLVPMYLMSSEPYLITDRIKIYRADYNTTTRDQVVIKWYNADGTLAGSADGNNNWSKTSPIYFGLCVNENGSVYIHIIGTTYLGAFASIPKSLSSSNAKTAAVSYAATAVSAITTPQVQYISYTPTYDQDGEWKIPIPWNADWPYLEGKSGADLGTGTGTVNPPTDNDYSGFLGTIIGWLQSIWGKLTDILTALGASIAEIIADLSNPFNWDKNPKGPSVSEGIGGFFAVLLALLLAIMHLIAKVIAFIGQLYNIPASTAMMNASMIEGINFAKGLETAGGVSLYGLITGTVSIIFGVVCFSLVRKSITGIGSASYIEAKESIPTGFRRTGGW